MILAVNKNKEKGSELNELWRVRWGKRVYKAVKKRQVGEKRLKTYWKKSWDIWTAPNAMVT